MELIKTVLDGMALLSFVVMISGCPGNVQTRGGGSGEASQAPEKGGGGE